MSGYAGNAFQYLRIGIAQVVKNDGFKAGFHQAYHGMRSDETHASGYEYVVHGLRQFC